jgi:hypothetical protein
MCILFEPAISYPSKDKVKTKYFKISIAKNVYQLITMAARHKVRTVLAPTNSSQGMDIFVRLFRICVVLYVGSGVATG